jgi:signal transduction histidine kinase
MLVLPSPSAGAGRWRLPLAGLSAARLAEALLSPDRPAAVTPLAEWLAADPAIVLWCVLGREFPSRDSPPCLRDVARWLLDHAPSALQWPEDELTSPLDASPCADRAAGLVEASVYVAEASRLQTPVQSDRLGDPAYLAYLLHNAAQWCDVLASTVPSVGISLREMPPLAQREAPSLPGWIQPQSFPDPSPAEIKAVRKVAAAARKRFLAPGPFAPTFLPQLMARLARQQQLESTFQQTLEAEKLAAMAEFAAGAGHEINNPLAIIAGRAQLFLSDEPDPQRRRDLAIINVQAMRVYEMIADMMLFARPPRPQLAEVDVVALVEQIAAAWSPKAAERRIALQRDLPPGPLLIAADATQLTVALRALLDNALQAIDSDGHVDISIRARILARSASEGAARTTSNPHSAAPSLALWASVVEAPLLSSGEFEIVVRDSGPGITPEVRRHLFDPYYSGRQAGRGLGLGLSKCWRIVTMHGGRIDVDSTPGQGATFRIVLPATREWKPDA